MPLIPGMEFHMNNGSWPSGQPSVFMTPNKVWGPLFSFAIIFVAKVVYLLEEVFFNG